MEILSASAKSLEATCTDFFSNLYQYCAQISITSSGVLNIPLLHIADATGAQLITDNLNTIGLPGKKFTVQ